MKTLVLQADASLSTGLKSMLKPFSVLEPVMENAPPFEALSYLAESSCDLVLLALDNSPESDALVAALASINSLPPLLVFVSHAELAIKAFDLGAFDCVIYPPKPERLFKAIQRLKALEKAKEYAHNQVISLPQNTRQGSGAVIYVKSDYKQVRLEVDKISFIQALKDYVKIFMVDQAKPVITQMNLKQMEERLPMSRFSRIHRSYIVAHHHISSVSRTAVYIGDSELPVGEYFRQAFFKAMEAEGSTY